MVERRSRRGVDGAWKRVLTDLLPEFVAFALPDLYAATDWSVVPVFLDKEFQSIARQSAVGSRIADLVVQLRLHSGVTTLLVLHIEVQGQPQEDFAVRMFTYYALVHLRLWRQQHRRAARTRADFPLILGVAVLTDDRDSWQPGPYEARGFDLGIRYDYRVLKLRDSQVRATMRALADNPFALVAQLWVEQQAARRSEESAAATLRATMLALRERHFRDDHLAAILAFIEQTTSLPIARYRALLAEIIETEGTPMAQVMSSIERKGWRQGREEGRLDIILRLAQRTIGPVDEATVARLQSLDVAALLDLTDALFAFADRDDLDRWLVAQGV